MRLLALFLLIFFSMASPGQAAETTAVVTNTKFTPYAEALDAFKKTYKGRADVFDLNGDTPEKIVSELKQGNYRLITAIGPAALRLSATIDKPSLLTGLVLNPHTHLGHRSGSLTGISMSMSAGESLRTLKQLAPAARRVALVYSGALDPALIEAAVNDMKAEGLVPVKKMVNDTAGAVEAYRSLPGQADAVYLLPDVTTVNDIVTEQLLEISLKNKIPVIGFSFKYVRSGALLALTFEPEDIGSQLGEMASSIIDGKLQPAAPFSMPARPSIHINARTAEIMGISIPAALRKSARIFTP
ncbi:MAG: hypothetical protein OEV28_01880 [Nitrospirota bacterium]|nr:hypothetical protein [Nitrospirota bacterium]